MIPRPFEEARQEAIRYVELVLYLSETENERRERRDDPWWNGLAEATREELRADPLGLGAQGFREDLEALRGGKLTAFQVADAVKRAADYEFNQGLLDNPTLLKLVRAHERTVDQAVRVLPSAREMEVLQKGNDAAGWTDLADTKHYVFRVLAVAFFLLGALATLWPRVNTVYLTIRTR